MSDSGNVRTPAGYLLRLDSPMVVPGRQKIRIITAATT